VVHTINVFLPLIRAGDAKRVISLSTGIADVPSTLQIGFPSAAPYCISKAALNMAVAKYAVRFRAEGIVFLALSPGLVNTNTRPPTSEEIEEWNRMVVTFKLLKPDWDGKPITAETSVKEMMKVISKLTIEDSGAFVSHHGNQEWL